MASCGERLVTARLGRLGTPPSRHYDLGTRSLAGSDPTPAETRVPVREARPREPKTATVELFLELGGVVWSFLEAANPL